MMKQNLLFLSLLLLFATVSASAYDFEYNGISYNILNSDEVTVAKYSSSNTSSDVVIPASVTHDEDVYTVTAISARAFSRCYFYSVKIPNTVITIGEHAFDNCILLESISIPQSVTTIGEGAFWACGGLESVKIPYSVTAIADYTFAFCSALTSVNLPGSITTIGKTAFGGCSSLESVTIPRSVTSIGDEAFDNCSALNGVTLPSSVTAIGVNPFKGCTSLTSISVESGNANYDSRGDCNAVIETASNTLIIGCQATVIPGTVKTIGKAAFEYCQGLTSVTIPRSVTTIGDLAFSACRNLTSVVLPGSVTTIGYASFSSCDALTTVTIPRSVTAIGTWAFHNCGNLTDVYCYITDPSRVSMGKMPFKLSGDDYSNRTLHVPAGTSTLYEPSEQWYPYFAMILEMKPELACDVNKDGAVNIADVNQVINAILSGNQGDNDDVNIDGVANITDINLIINYILTH